MAITSSTMDILRKVLPAALVVITTLALSGCTSIDGDLASEREVLHEVAKQVPTEKYELVSVDHDTKSRPKVDTYHFASKERDLQFDVVSTLESFGIDGGVIGYTQHISVGYADAVHELYSDGIDALLSEYPVNAYSKHEYSSYAALGGVADALVACDTLYRQELKYNKAKWLQENPATEVMLAYPYINESGDKKELFTTSVRIDGTLEREALYEKITYDHVHQCVRENVADLMIPAEAYSRVHPDELNIFAGSQNLSVSGAEKAREDGLYNNLDSAYRCEYYYDWNAYVMPLDLGLTDDKYAPQLLELYCDALGYQYNVDYNKGHATWTTASGAEWEIRAKDNRDHEITKFQVYRNGVKQKIKWLSNGAPNYPGGPMYCLYVSVSDFEKMFEVHCQVDEGDGKLVMEK